MVLKTKRHKCPPRVTRQSVRKRNDSGADKSASSDIGIEIESLPGSRAGSSANSSSNSCAASSAARRSSSAGSSVGSNSGNMPDKIQPSTASLPLFDASKLRRPKSPKTPRPYRSKGKEKHQGPEGTTFRYWMNEVDQVLEKPGLAVTLFVLGVLFIIIASKQVEFSLAYAERLGLGRRPREGLMGYLVVPLVFFFVTIDIVLVNHFKKAAVKWYYKIVAACDNTVRGGRKRRMY